MEKMYSRIEKVKDGEFIMEEDTWAYFAFVLREGKARMMKKVDGRQVVIGTLNKGDILGKRVFSENQGELLPLLQKVKLWWK